MVFVVQNAMGASLARAKIYGNIRELFPPSAQVMEDATSHVANLRDLLADFTTDDHILLMGDPVLIGLAIAIAAERTKRLKLLKWDRRRHTYFVVETNLS